MNLRIAACALLGLFGAALYGAEVYRSTDANGNVAYSDRPQGRDSDLVIVATPRAATPALQPAAPATAAAAPASAQTPTAAAQPPQPPPEPTAEERAKNCALARERLQRYQESHRLYRALDNGEREYLSDAEIDEARARAATSVETWCG